MSKFSWLGVVFSPITQWLKNRGEKQQAAHQRDLAIINNQARLAQSTKDYNHEWEMASLQDKDKTLRFISYFMFTSPILITVISPTHGNQIFTNLESVPSWLVQTWVAINGGVWGIASLKNVVPEFIHNFKRKGADNGNVTKPT
ncbi:hypothetical protein L3V43_20570 [Pseudoalteromonas sp. L23]|uniref:hypothetical protein n=1 Tax=unclassified Pseudoalteromonas TaxID=194690 RepID=UPI001EF02BEA|nr:MULTISPECIES: hypothetical protein [unclassified Pseudoalteromonas]MCF7515981.1 hypothetical protein [Pseudoalteromonas sp. L7]MCF7528047.1 hypothetical protein [Pseudoalteromonas sp. L23]